MATEWLRPADGACSAASEALPEFMMELYDGTINFIPSLETEKEVSLTARENDVAAVY